MQHKLKTEMFEHQKKAFDKLKKLKVSALFMDTGTGKTRTAIEFIDYRFSKEKIDRVIWLCPVSCKGGLIEDIEKHSYYTAAKIENYTDEDICVVGLESISQSNRTYLKMRNLITDKTYCIIDESHYIKNPDSIRSIRMMKEKDNFKYRTVMTGTPMTNGYQDLFTQLFFLHPAILGYNSFAAFAKNHIVYSEDRPDQILKVEDTEYITRRMNPYCYEVNKDECTDLPDKTYQKIYFNMDSEQTSYYFKAREVLVNDLIDFENLKATDIFMMFNILHRIACGYVDIVFKKQHFFFKGNKRVNEFGKVIKSIDLKSNKCIVWYRYNSDLESIKSYFEKEDIEAAYLNGEQNENEKESNLKAFKNNINILVANISTGAVGHNLQCANYMIYYDNTFDFGDRYQSEDRMYRIGQEKNCTIIDLIAENTIDERISKCLDRKSNALEELRSEINRIKDDKELVKEFKEKIEKTF